MAFYLEEAGFGQIEIHRLSPAIDSMPELAELPDKVPESLLRRPRRRIVARRL